MKGDFNESERERERVIKGWQVCLLTCVLVFFACLTFFSVPAFADEGEGASSAELQSSVIGGDTFESATVLPLNTTNTFTIQENQSYYYYKIVLTQDGYINFPSKFKMSNSYDINEISFYHSDHTLFWGSYPSYYDQNLGLGEGTYYLKVNAQSYYSGDTVTMKVNFTSSDCWEKESNDSFDAANTLSDLSKTYYGSNAENSSDDYFKFYISGTKNVEVNIASENYSRVYLYKDNVNHDKISDWYQSANISGSVNDYSKQQLTQGWYYLRIDPNNKYSFKINATTVNSSPMYRLYNKWSGEHLFTSSTSECNNLEKIGWKKEGEAWKSPSTSGTPVYRLYNKYSGDHHYTTSKDEYEACGKAGWNKEGVAWYSDDSKGKPVYRLFNPYVTIGTHHYTTDKGEYDYLETVGWRQEGEGWYGLK